MSYAIVPSDPSGDRSSVLDLWSRNLPDATPERYAWLYENGPANGWLARSTTDGIVGATGLMTRTFHDGGRILQAGQAIDLNVDARHRMARPALALQRAVTQRVRNGQLDFLYGFPNPQSARVLGRVGYQSLGRVQRWFRPLRCASLLEGRVPGRLLRSVAGTGLDMALSAKAALRKPHRPPGVRLSTADQFDRRFDDLWHRANRQFTLIGQRTSAYLAWRLGSCPQARYRIACLSGPGEDLVAYAAYCLDDRAIAHVADFFFADPASLEPLFWEFARYLRSQGARAIVVVYFGTSLVSARLHRLGFWQRPSDWHVMVYVDQDPTNHRLDGLSDPERWYLTRADTDTDL